MLLQISKFNVCVISRKTCDPFTSNWLRNSSPTTNKLSVLLLLEDTMFYLVLFCVIIEPKTPCLLGMCSILPLNRCPESTHTCFLDRLSVFAPSFLFLISDFFDSLICIIYYHDLHSFGIDPRGTTGNEEWQTTHTVKLRSGRSDTFCSHYGEGGTSRRPSRFHSWSSTWHGHADANNTHLLGTSIVPYNIQWGKWG